YHKKYGIRDHRGGGRASARETISRVVAGAIARQILSQQGIKIFAYVSQLGDIELKKSYRELELSKIDEHVMRCPDPQTAARMMAHLDELSQQNDTAGGVITCVVTGVPAGWGEPVFNKLHADLGSAILGINAAKGFEYGSGFAGTSMKGSQHNDIFYSENKKIHTKTNHSGGIQGGISNGEDIYFRVAFKPVATLLKKQETVDLRGDNVTITPRGRHDATVLPRAVPIVEAMTALVLINHFYFQQIYISTKNA
ncbi:MAG: chorismate synthase, partial [Prolixibacteraceae bacterium]|nr:chorismate synthase [Prolixibacteraceae bacterium]